MRRRNPFEKFLTAEDHTHKGILDYIHLAYSGIRPVHVPNEGRRSPFERFKATWLGIKAGVPDILIFEPRGSYHGLAIEVKSETGTLSKSQKDWIDYLHRRMWATSVVDNLEEGIKLIDAYLTIKR